ncbi:MAG TPA: hypothetical protein VEP68_04420, partial [Anaeromyxobacteraceae bacterium]|nr:hypothetical protein [Anaeromyxobacteraceae bacterium]
DSPGADPTTDEEIDMMKMRNLGWLLVAGALAAPLAAAAQAGPGPGACAGQGKMGRSGAGRFDPATATTVQGRIVDVQRIDRGRRHQGVHLSLAVGSETLPVLLGPDFYVDAQATKLAAGDDVEVKGSRATFGGKPALVAQEVRRGGEVLALRDADGVPLWRGQGGGR